MADLFGLKEALALDPYYVGAARMQAAKPKWGERPKDYLAAALYGLTSGALEGYGTARAEDSVNQANQAVLDYYSTGVMPEKGDNRILNNVMASLALEDQKAEKSATRAWELHTRKKEIDREEAINKEKEIRALGPTPYQQQSLSNQQQRNKEQIELRNTITLFKEDSKLLRGYAEAGKAPPPALVKRYNDTIKKLGSQTPTQPQEATEGTGEKLRTSLLPENTGLEEPTQYAFNDASREVISGDYTPQEIASIAAGAWGGAGDLVGEVPEGIPEEFAGLWGTGKKKGAAGIGEAALPAIKDELLRAGVRPELLNAITPDTSLVDIARIKGLVYQPSPKALSDISDLDAAAVRANQLLSAIEKYKDTSWTEWQAKGLFTTTDIGKLRQDINLYVKQLIKATEGARPSDFDAKTYARIVKGDFTAGPQDAYDLVRQVARGMETRNAIKKKQLEMGNDTRRYNQWVEQEKLINLPASEAKQLIGKPLAFKPVKLKGYRIESGYSPSEKTTFYRYVKE